MNKGIRIINFLIDIISISVISTIIMLLIGNQIYTKIVFLFVFIFYYCLFELILGQTLGKMVTKTKVVDLSGSQPDFKRIILRTLLRLNPFDTASFLFGINLGTHDVLSKTKLKTKLS